MACLCHFALDKNSRRFCPCLLNVSGGLCEMSPERQHDFWLSTYVLSDLLSDLSYPTAFQWEDWKLFSWQFLSHVAIIKYFNILLRFSPHFVLFTMMYLLLFCWSKSLKTSTCMSLITTEVKPWTTSF